MVEFAINSSVNATTGYTPFELNYGYMLQSGQHISTDTTFMGVKQFAQQAVWNLMDAVGDPSKIRPYSSLIGLLLSLFSLTAFSSRKPKNKRKAE